MYNSSIGSVVRISFSTFIITIYLRASQMHLLYQGICQNEGIFKVKKVLPVLKINRVPPSSIQLSLCYEFTELVRTLITAFYLNRFLSCSSGYFWTPNESL